MATESSRSLAVEFLEQVFMKNANAYKSAFFQTIHLDAGFQEGRAIDRQSIGTDELSAYWIKDFLKSQIRTTGPAGTRRLAEAVRSAVKDAEDPDLKQELVATATLLRGQAGKNAIHDSDFGESKYIRWVRLRQSENISQSQN